MPTLERAIQIAVAAHAGQTDKSGASYILHPLRVMFACRSVDARIVAVLHDVVEDTDWTLERLDEEGFAEEVLRGIEAVTRRPDESYEDFCRRAGADPLGREVKRADLMDNLDASRLSVPLPEGTAERMQRYLAALELLA